MPSAEKAAKKKAYFERLIELVESHQQILIVHADHVGSNQIQQIRASLRGKAIILMGKNTMVRTALRQHLSKMPQLEKLIPVVRGNIGFVFCIGDMNEVRQLILANKVPTMAKAGVFAPCDVVVPAGPTGMDPSQTSFFQALNIPTKIQKGQIEIINSVDLIQTGNKVQMSEQVLLQKLNIRPFAYGFVVQQVYDNGAVYDAKILDLTDDVLAAKFMVGVQNVAALGREIGIPTSAGCVHMVVNAFKNLAGLILGLGCDDLVFKEMAKIDEFIKDPSAFASAVAAPAADSGAAKAEEKAPEPEESSDDGGGMDLFGGDDY